VPILDTTLVTVVRLLEGRPVTEGGRDHTSHRLVYQGLSDKRAVVLLAIVSAALGLTSLAYKVLDDQRITLVGVLITFAFLLQFGSYLAAVDRTTTPTEAGSFVRSLLVHRQRFIEVLVDFALITASFTIAFIIRVEDTMDPVPPWMRHVFIVSLPAILVARYVVFALFGLYRGVWRYAGGRDAAVVVLAVVCSEAIAFLYIWATVPWNGFPRGTYLIDVLLCAFLIGVSRFWERGVAHAIRSFVGRSRRERTLIVGAGTAGRSLLRELRESSNARVIGFVDDNAQFRGRRIQGVPVLGDLAQIGIVLGRSAPETVLVTIPEAERDRLDGVVEACRRAGVACRFVRRQLDLDPAAVLGAAAE
jgi:UDP-GlcNAc:undecaprenyl-phosphate/decaprenyl-phosphate GlcNAc-1-phosphate transferase